MGCHTAAVVLYAVLGGEAVGRDPDRITLWAGPVVNVEALVLYVNGQPFRLERKTRVTWEVA